MCNFFIDLPAKNSALMCSLQSNAIICPTLCSCLGCASVAVSRLMSLSLYSLSPDLGIRNQPHAGSWFVTLKEKANSNHRQEGLLPLEGTGSARGVRWCLTSTVVTVLDTMLSCRWLFLAALAWWLFPCLLSKGSSRLTLSACSCVGVG